MKTKHVDLRKINGTAVNFSVEQNRNGLYYARDGAMQFAQALRTARKAFDKDGVITSNASTLNIADSRTFKKYGAKLDQNLGVHYTISVDTRGWLEVLNGYTSTSKPNEAIIAVNRHSTERKASKPEETFITIRRMSNDPVQVLGDLREHYLNDSDRALALEMFNWRTQTEYRKPSVARHTREVPGAARSFIDIVRLSENEGPGIQTHIITSTETQRLNKMHLTAAFTAAGYPDGVVKELFRKVGMITAEDVKHLKPNPEGILRIMENGRTTIYFGDGHGDAKAAKAAGAEFCAVVNDTKKAAEFLQYDPIAIVDHLEVIADMLKPIRP